MGMRRPMVVVFLTLVMLGLATPAWAQDGQDGGDEFVVLSGHADVPEGEQVGDLVVFHGSATVDGTVNGSLTAFDAPVTISGRVDGDVVSQNEPTVEQGATIGGDTRRIQTNFNWDGFGWAGRLAWWLAVSVSTLVVGLVLLWLLGRGAPRIVDAAWTGIGPSIGWGLLAFFGLPIVGIIALVTLVGIPLGLGVLAALGLICALGYAATAWIVGRRIVREPTAWILAFLAGWGILRVLALVPIVGGLVGWAAVVLGLGALIVAIWRARTTSQAAPATA
jgi:hypothetical protein